MASRLAKASMWAVAGTAAQSVTTFLLLVYLAHILHPRDFGLMSTIAVGLDLGSVITRWGQVELLQQQRYRTDEARQASFRLAMLISCGFSAAYVALAWPVANAFHAPAVVWMMYLCAPIFMLMGSGITPEALLRNEFRYRLLATRNTVTTCISGVMAVILASIGYGPIALAAQRLIGVTILTIWNWASVSWRPRIGASQRVPGLFREGASVMIGTILPTIVPRSVDLLVSAFLGPARLGLMRIAYRVFDFLAQMVIMPLVSVATAQFGSLGSDVAALRGFYLRITRLSAGLICPLLIGFGLVADRAVPLLFGPQWTGSVVLVRLVSASALVAPINYYFSIAMVAVGQSGKVLRQGLFQLVLGLALAAAAAPISIAAVVAAQLLRATLTSLYNIVDLRRHMGLSFRAVGTAMLPAYASVAVMTAGVILFRVTIGMRLAPVADLAASSIIGGGLYLGTVFLGDRLGFWSGYISMLETILPAPLRATLRLKAR